MKESLMYFLNEYSYDISKLVENNFYGLATLDQGRAKLRLDEAQHWLTSKNYVFSFAEKKIILKSDIETEFQNLPLHKESLDSNLLIKENLPNTKVPVVEIVKNTSQYVTGIMEQVVDKKEVKPENIIANSRILETYSRPRYNETVGIYHGLNSSYLSLCSFDNSENTIYPLSNLYLGNGDIKEKAKYVSVLVKENHIGKTYDQWVSEINKLLCESTDQNVKQRYLSRNKELKYYFDVAFKRLYHEIIDFSDQYHNMSEEERLQILYKIQFPGDDFVYDDLKKTRRVLKLFRKLYLEYEELDVNISNFPKYMRKWLNTEHMRIRHRFMALTPRDHYILDKTVSSVLNLSIRHHCLNSTNLELEQFYYEKFLHRKYSNLKASQFTNYTKIPQVVDMLEYLEKFRLNYETGKLQLGRILTEKYTEMEDYKTFNLDRVKATSYPRLTQVSSDFYYYTKARQIKCATWTLQTPQFMTEYMNGSGPFRGFRRR